MSFVHTTEVKILLYRPAKLGLQDVYRKQERFQLFNTVHQSAASPWGPPPGHPRDCQIFVIKPTERLTGRLKMINLLPDKFDKMINLLPEGVGENIAFVHRDCTPGADHGDLQIHYPV